MHLIVWHNPLTEVYQCALALGRDPGMISTCCAGELRTSGQFSAASFDGRSYSSQRGYRAQKWLLLPVGICGRRCAAMRMHALTFAGGTRRGDANAIQRQYSGVCSVKDPVLCRNPVDATHTTTTRNWSGNFSKKVRKVQQAKWLHAAILRTEGYYGVIRASTGSPYASKPNVGAIVTAVEAVKAALERPIRYCNLSDNVDVQSNSHCPDIVSCTQRIGLDQVVESSAASILVLWRLNS